MSDTPDPLEFSDPADQPTRYIDRITRYYQALGYEKPYRWASYAHVPFTRPSKPLAGSRVALVTTAAPYRADAGDQGPGAPYNSAAKFYRLYSESIDGDTDVRVSHVGIDRKHTTAEDPATWFPLAQLKRLAASGRVGEVAPRFHGLPTNRSHRVTVQQDCEDLLAAIREDAADAAILVAN